MIHAAFIRAFPICNHIPPVSNESQRATQKPQEGPASIHSNIYPPTCQKHGTISGKKNHDLPKLPPYPWFGGVYGTIRLRDKQK